MEEKCLYKRLNLKYNIEDIEIYLMYVLMRTKKKIISRLTDSKESTDHAQLSYVVHNKWSSKKEHRADALALRADERRDKLR